MIDTYRFGKITIAGKTYHRDVIIYPDRVDSNWRRQQGHVLEPADISEVTDSKPDIIIIGTGQPGLMHVSNKTLEQMKKLKIETMVMPTEQACKEYNRIARHKNVIACLHLTC
ncbi:hypothetical protein IBX73_09540 [candidate division WOR-3 bacterium]|nr:hypothetical protein [candidate division WOR-3 bacterium]